MDQSIRIIDVHFANKRLFVSLEDGREISVPLSWFQLLENCSYDCLNSFKICNNGTCIYWEMVDELISIEEILTNTKLVY